MGRSVQAGLAGSLAVATGRALLAARAGAGAAACRSGGGRGEGAGLLARRRHGLGRRGRHRRGWHNSSLCLRLARGRGRRLLHVRRRFRFAAGALARRDRLEAGQVREADRGTGLDELAQGGLTGAIGEDAVSVVLPGIGLAAERAAARGAAQGKARRAGATTACHAEAKAPCAASVVSVGFAECEVHPPADCGAGTSAERRAERRRQGRAHVRLDVAIGRGGIRGASVFGVGVSVSVVLVLVVGATSASEKRHCKGVGRGNARDSGAARRRGRGRATVAAAAVSLRCCCGGGRRGRASQRGAAGATGVAGGAGSNEGGGQGQGEGVSRSAWEAVPEGAEAPEEGGRGRNGAGGASASGQGRREGLRRREGRRAGLQRGRGGGGGQHGSDRGRSELGGRGEGVDGPGDDGIRAAEAQARGGQGGCCCGGRGGGRAGCRGVLGGRLDDLAEGQGGRGGVAEQPVGSPGDARSPCEVEVERRGRLLGGVGRGGRARAEEHEVVVGRQGSQLCLGLCLLGREGVEVLAAHADGPAGGGAAGGLLGGRGQEDDGLDARGGLCRLLRLGEAPDMLGAGGDGVPHGDDGRARRRGPLAVLGPVGGGEDRCEPRAADSRGRRLGREAASGDALHGPGERTGHEVPALHLCRGCGGEGCAAGGDGEVEVGPVRGGLGERGAERVGQGLPQGHSGAVGEGQEGAVAAPGPGGDGLVPPEAHGAAGPGVDGLGGRGLGGGDGGLVGGSALAAGRGARGARALSRAAAPLPHLEGAGRGRGHGRVRGWVVEEDGDVPAVGLGHLGGQDEAAAGSAPSPEAQAGLGAELGRGGALGGDEAAAVGGEGGVGHAELRGRGAVGPGDPVAGGHLDLRRVAASARVEELEAGAAREAVDGHAAGARVDSEAPPEVAAGGQGEGRRGRGRARESQAPRTPEDAEGGRVHHDEGAVREAHGHERGQRDGSGGRAGHGRRLCQRADGGAHAREEVAG
mmetsp:Transcript_15018/g.56601  ORF Transcript_15018/g.56601 Transcript_15018/m.56601 type:complete len:978 (-) Transcript_15018:1095-4028(-)